MESNKIGEDKVKEKFTTVELLAQKKQETKELTEKLKEERIANKSVATKLRAERDNKIKNDAEVLKKIKDLIFGYNKIGKVKKGSSNIVGRIHNICKDYLYDEALEKDLVVEE